MSIDLPSCESGRCYCGANDWNAAATLIACKQCGRTWGRCNGFWVFDPESEPPFVVTPLSERVEPDGVLESLAEVRRRWPTLRIGQIVANAHYQGGGRGEVFYASDWQLLVGLRRLLEDQPGSGT